MPLNELDSIPLQISHAPALVSLVALLAAALLVAPDVVQGATFTVNRTADAVDAAPGDDVCETAAGNGVCTLRAAIQETNAQWRSDTILLPPGTYQITVPGADEDLGATGDLDTTPVGTYETRITGGRRSVTFIDGGDLDRVLHVRGNVVLEDLTVRNGNVTSFRGGGGIYVATGTLTLRRVTVRDNQSSTIGGGITLEPNTGIAASLMDSRAQGNLAASVGGGILCLNALELPNSYVTENEAETGGGMYVAGARANATVRNSRIELNAATDSGGGIYIGESSAATLWFEGGGNRL